MRQKVPHLHPCRAAEPRRQSDGIVPQDFVIRGEQKNLRTAGKPGEQRRGAGVGGVVTAEDEPQQIAQPFAGQEHIRRRVG